jgi:acetyltransferase-like isoleucine patch superfamily enzyme
MIRSPMESSTEPIAAPPSDLPPELRGPPPPLHGGLLTLLRFMRRHRMLNLKYGVLLLRLGAWKLRLRGRLRLDGIAFIGPGCRLEVGPNAVLELGRWSWLGHGCKIRCHEGRVHVGAKSVMGQECTISAYKHVRIGEQCVIADRAMFIDFDHGVVEVERPIRVQGIYTRECVVGSNVWVGYGACVLRGVRVGDNAIVGTNSVVTRNVPANAVVGGVPAKVIRMREAPEEMSWPEPVEPTAEDQPPPQNR